MKHLFRNVGRWTEIVGVLSKYGLADWLSGTNIPFIRERLRTRAGERLTELSHEKRIRLALVELGPTFIKFGQLLSTRPDVIGMELADELSHLQTDVPADSLERLKPVIEAELGRPMEQCFSYFEPTARASASIGQVHNAVTIDGRDVVVKVRHVGIVQKVDTDLEILAGLAHLAERREELRHYQPASLVHNLGRTLRRELDFNLEARNLAEFRHMFRREPLVAIPEPIEALCSRGVLTMQRLEGTQLKDNHRLRELNVDTADLARRGADLYLRMIFDYGVYHADPHPGNLLVSDEGRIIILDFGMVGRVNDQLRDDIGQMLIAIVQRDVSSLVTLVERVGACPPNLPEAELSADLADMVGAYATQNLSHFDTTGALNDLIAIVRRYKITLPGEAALLLKVLVTLDGTGRLMNPDFSLAELMRPIQRRLLRRRLSPVYQASRLRRMYMQMEYLLERLPSRLGNILDQIQSGKFDVHLDHRRLGPTANRLVMGMMFAAMFLGSSIMLSTKVPPLLFPQEGGVGFNNISVVGLVGLLFSLALGLRIYRAIRKSGDLDRMDPT